MAKGPAVRKPGLSYLPGAVAEQSIDHGPSYADIQQLVSRYGKNIAFKDGHVGQFSRRDRTEMRFLPAGKGGGHGETVDSLRHGKALVRIPAIWTGSATGPPAGHGRVDTCQRINDLDWGIRAKNYGRATFFDCADGVGVASARAPVSIGHLIIRSGVQRLHGRYNV